MTRNAVIGFAGGRFSFRVVSAWFVQLLRRIMRYLQLGRSSRLSEEFIGHIIGIVATADGNAVADPPADCVLWEGHRPLLFAGLA